MFDFTVLEALQEQFHKQRDRMAHRTILGLDSHTEQKTSKCTLDLIELQYHLRYDDKSGKWLPTRKPRQRPLQEGQAVEMWVTRGAKDRLCRRFEGELYNQGMGPIPGHDTHPNCRCVRELVAVVTDDGNLGWATPKPRNKRKPKIRVPDDYKEPANPYDPDSIRTPDPVFP